MGSALLGVFKGGTSKGRSLKKASEGARQKEASEGGPRKRGFGRDSSKERLQKGVVRRVAVAPFQLGIFHLLTPFHLVVHTLLLLSILLKSS